MEFAGFIHGKDGAISVRLKPIEVNPKPPVEPSPVDTKNMTNLRDKIMANVETLSVELPKIYKEPKYDIDMFIDDGMKDLYVKNPKDHEEIDDALSRLFGGSYGFTMMPCICCDEDPAFIGMLFVDDGKEESVCVNCFYYKTSAEITEAIKKHVEENAKKKPTKRRKTEWTLTESEKVHWDELRDSLKKKSV